MRQTMQQPAIMYYALLSRCKSTKTPKYTVTAQAGFYAPMLELTGKDGRISVYLLQSKESGMKKDNAPAMRLQAKNSFNFTGLHEFYTHDGRMSGFAYGYPPDMETYGAKRPRRNPFFAHCADGFLFIAHQDPGAATAAERLLPSCIELVVLEGARVCAASYLKQLQMGGFDAELEALRKLAGVPPSICRQKPCTTR